jgi:hypothetical protein
MTLLVSWLAVDTHGPTSAYITSDSRISWGERNNFDYGRKVFAFNNSPDILGYCGDVLFPSIVLSQIVEMGNCGLLFKEGYTSKQKFEVIKEVLVQSFLTYPNEVDLITSNTLQVVYISREASDNKKFFCHLIGWERGKGWSGREVIIPDRSDLLLVLGSGRTEFVENYKRYQEGPNQNTSRNVFHCFSDTLFNINDKHCGGAPQLVGIYRKPDSNARKFGIIKDKKRYLFGARIDKLKNFGNIEWRNDLFELCDGNTMKRIDVAQSQPNELKKY